MEKKVVTEEMRPQDEWFKRAKNDIRTPEDLKNFAEELLEGYEHDYGTVCHAISALSVAAAWLGAHIQGITGFQAGFVMWGFIRHWNRTGNKCGMKLVDYDDFLYPQYDYRFEKTITPDVWKGIQEEAKNRLNEEPNYACDEVRAHWQSIVDGKIPFGYVLKED